MAGKQERQRRLARERYERRLARQAQRQQAMRKTAAWVAGGLVLVVVAGVVTLTVLHLSNKNASAQGTPPATPSTSTTPSASPTPTPTLPAEPATHCTYVQSGSPARPVGGLPPATPDNKATYTATIKTNRGDIVIDLLNSKATCTVNSFVFLAAKSYFSNTHCHRLVTSGIYVLQCGDPTGTGSGGPGYEFANENLATAKTPTATVTYSTGTVAMANAGPGTNGSQFFLVYKNSPLQPAYTPFGTIVSGLNILQQVASAGTANKSSDGPPKEAVIIESVAIKKT